MDKKLFFFRILMFIFGTMIAGLDGGIIVALAFIGEEAVQRMFRKR